MQQVDNSVLNGRDKLGSADDKQYVSVESKIVKTWRKYQSLVRVEAFDYELSLKLVNERAKYGLVMLDLSRIIDIGLNNATRINYCNRTGQPIGVNLITAGGLDYNGSIAAQWLRTGPDSLKEHCKETPIAYTVYMINKTLIKPDSIDGINERLTELAGIYAVLQRIENETDCAAMISVLQTALWVNSKLGRCGISTKYGAQFQNNTRELYQICRAIADGLVISRLDKPETIKDILRGLNIWCGNVLGRLASKDMPATLDDIETLIAARIQGVEFAEAGKNTTMPVSIADKAAFTNIPTRAKSQRSGWGATMEKKKVVSDNIAALGDIF